MNSLSQAVIDDVFQTRGNTTTVGNKIFDSIFLPYTELTPEINGILLSALQTGWGIAHNGSPIKERSDSKKPLRIPLQPFKINKDIQKSTHALQEQFNQFGLINEMPERLRQQAIKLFCLWNRKKHGEVIAHNDNENLQNFISPAQPNLHMLYFTNASGQLIGAAQVYLIDNSKGPVAAYGLTFFYDPRLLVNNPNPAVKQLGLGILNALMQELNRLGYHHFYVGNWEPDMQKNLFYKIRLAKNTEILHDGAWIDARQYWRSLKP